MDKHISVLKDEAIELLDVKEDGIYVDGTLGRGGHSLEILKRLKNGQLYVFDLDEKAIKESKEFLKDYSNVIYIHDNFMNMNKYIQKVDGVLLDLGVSSPQFDEASRGFSYKEDALLDMRMNQSQSLNAYEVVNTYSKEALAKILWMYGEEKYANNIARKIVEKRSLKPIETTLELVEVIKSALPSKRLREKGHPCKQSFQAIRIEVNHELDSLNSFLSSIDEMLKVNGRLVIITFHSLEDRMVKHCFKELSSIHDDKRIALKPEEIEKARFALINHKAIIANDEELENNSRAKSAKLRGLIKLRENNG